MAYLNPAAGNARQSGGTVAAPAALTAATGTSDGTVADVGASFAQATLNNNFKDVATGVNNLRTALISAGVLT